MPESLQRTSRNGWRCQEICSAIELRSAEGMHERPPLLPAELARAKLAMIVASGVKALVATKGATDSIPIVIPATSSDIVAMGLIQSLARPGGNITGSTSFGSEFLVERLEILKDVLPRFTRAGILANPRYLKSRRIPTRLLAPGCAPEPGSSPVEQGLAVTALQQGRDGPKMIGVIRQPANFASHIHFGDGT